MNGASAHPLPRGGTQGPLTGIPGGGRKGRGGAGPANAFSLMFHSHTPSPGPALPRTGPPQDRPSPGPALPKTTSWTPFLGPPSAGPPSAGPPKISLFLFPLPPHLSFFPPEKSKRHISGPQRFRNDPQEREERKKNVAGEKKNRESLETTHFGAPHAPEPHFSGLPPAPTQTALPVPTKKTIHRHVGLKRC